MGTGFGNAPLNRALRGLNPTRGTYTYRPPRGFVKDPGQSDS